MSVTNHQAVTIFMLLESFRGKNVLTYKPLISFVRLCKPLFVDIFHYDIDESEDYCLVGCDSL
jgi:hypothetical protein